MPAPAASTRRARPTPTPRRGRGTLRPDRRAARRGRAPASPVPEPSAAGAAVSWLPPLGLQSQAGPHARLQVARLFERRAARRRQRVEPARQPRPLAAARQVGLAGVALADQAL